MKSVTLADALRAQLRLALRARTVNFMLAMAVFPWVFVVLIFKLTTDGNDLAGSLGPELLLSPLPAFYCLALGAMWGLLAWRDEPPKARFYHWSLPVDVTAHEASRLIAYMMWLFVGMTAYLACGLALLIGNGVPLRLEDVGPMPWIASYVAGVIGFLITASVSTAVNRPVEYIAATFVGLWGLALLSVVYKFDTLRSVLTNAFGTASDYSLASAIMHAGSIAMRFASNDDLYVTAMRPNPPVIGPLALWLAVSLACAVAGLYVNRGRAT